jgi:ribose transport system ATP-binding protein
MLQALFGSVPFDGDVTLFGNSYQPANIREAIRRGVGLVPENRKTEGLIISAPIYRNAQLAAMRRRTFLSQRALECDCQDALTKLSTKYASADQPVARLSGGNQQKVVLAKWIIDGSRLLLLDEPSRGLDVGAKAELYRLARSLATQGDAVIVASSEFEELYINCDRIWVIHEGRNVACFDPSETTSEAIQHTTITGRSA